ncbi:ribonuclease D [Desulfuromusa kysingii]|uniref:Ribonuclease D n=1 Tax=Desulfuromusa kysingii TaxID=37625 RepID=A0A1H3VHL2_9BACT|nr:HRDC domain-containing protein [Desulfuromusa kysingii]SDZ73668.1 ribonuclease D [Desulfuromusa kysingii]
MSLPPILTTTDEITEFATELEKHQVIAVDLEADSMHNYQEKVCLLQFSTPQTTVLIDPLQGADLAALKPVLANPRIRKIFHAADYDIRCLARDFDIEINGLFDTMISSQFLGEERFGLADVLRKYFAVELDKQYQRADWSKRPLSEAMIRYAAGDTSYLHQLVENLEGQLIAKGRLEWVKEEFMLMEKVRFMVHEGPLFLRFKGAGTLNRRQLAVLENLLQWRDTEAKRRDTPLYKVIGNKTLLQLAKLSPENQSSMQKVEGLSPRLIERYGNALLQQITMANEIAEEDLPTYPRGERRLKDPQIEKRMNRLKDWRKQVATELQLDPGVLINNALLDEIARKQPRDQDELAEIVLLKNWQRQVLGEGILQSLS